MKDALLLVFANKQDLPNAMKPDELSRRLKLDEIARDHIWKVEPSCATTGEGIFEGLVCRLIDLTEKVCADKNCAGMAGQQC